jgi:hypothetical protein
MIRGQKAAMLTSAALFGAFFSISSASEPTSWPTKLAHMSSQDLECLYRQAEPGRIPDGFARGRVRYCPESFIADVKSAATRLLWQGKVFRAEEGTLVNQWSGLRAIRATVYQGTSWLDGKPAIIIDYSETSRVWSNVRDEMREIAPGEYLGAMYVRGCPEPRLKLFFVLHASK